MSTSYLSAISGVFTEQGPCRILRAERHIPRREPVPSFALLDLLTRQIHMSLVINLEVFGSLY